jgi:hypothetical protein
MKNRGGERPMAIAGEKGDLVVLERADHEVRVPVPVEVGGHEVGRHVDRVESHGTQQPARAVAPEDRDVVRPPVGGRDVRKPSPSKSSTASPVGESPAVGNASEPTKPPTPTE